jgi:hypothetical protein
MVRPNQIYRPLVLEMLASSSALESDQGDRESGKPLDETPMVQREAPPLIDVITEALKSATH